MLKTLPVPQHHTTEPNILINAIQSRLPIKISGLVENWPASQWTIEIVKSKDRCQKSQGSSRPPSSWRDSSWRSG